MTATAVPAEGDLIATSAHGLTARALRAFARQPLAVAALIAVAAIFTAGALSHTIHPHEFITLSPRAIHRPPSLSHPFGTDALGRDMFFRTLYGVETTAEVALGSALLATLIGVIAGALSGYYGGWLDTLIMRLADLVTALPAILLILAVIVYLGEAYPRNLIFIFTGIMWAVVARVVRAHVASLRVMEFVEAARAAGASNMRVVFRHLLPNASGTILVAGTALIGQIVLIDATVEFFSLGLPSAIVPSLGNLVSDVVQNRFTNNPFPNTGWWVWIFPCGVLVLILVCVNLVGDALDAAFNPTAKQ